MLHPEFMIYSLLDLYITISGEEKINIANLKKAFEILTLKFITMENITFNFNFDLILYNLCEKYSNYLTIDNEELIVDNLEELFKELEENISMADFDYNIDEYIHNINIYEALNLTIPLEEYQNLFKINNRIMQLYTLIAESDYKNNFKEIPLLISKLRKTITDLTNKLEELTLDDLLGLKMCFAKYNLCLSLEEELFTNSGWNIALFSKNPTQMKKLRYERLEYLASEMEFKLFNEALAEDDEEIDSSLIYDNTSEFSIFFTYYLLYLNNYLKRPLPDFIREALTIKKYLLLSMPELRQAENHFLNHNTIENLEFPNLNPEIISPTSFEILLEKAFVCATNLDYSDEELKIKPHKYYEMVLNALFVKCFLNLCQNENSKKDIINLITSSRFYNTPKYYNTTITLINDIIFSKDISHYRNK